MEDRFTTRVLLHNAESEDYENLHEFMEAEGFTRTIISDSGIEYHLPDAEYNLIGNYTGDTVRTMAKAAANKTKKKNAVLVTPSNGRHWSGLDKVED